MDDFFNAIASLMSDLLRRTIQRSLSDLIDMMELYKEGNNYQGDYHILRGLAVAKLKQPATIFLVMLYLQISQCYRAPVSQQCHSFLSIVKYILGHRIFRSCFLIVTGGGNSYKNNYILV